MAAYSTPHSPLTPVMARADTCAPTSADFPVPPARVAPAAEGVTWLVDDHDDGAACDVDFSRYASDTPLDHHEAPHNGSFAGRGAWHSHGVSPTMTPASHPRTAAPSPRAFAAFDESLTPALFSSSRLADLPPPMAARKPAPVAQLDELELSATPVDDFAATNDVESPNRPTTAASRARRCSPVGKGAAAAARGRVRVPKAAAVAGEAGFAALVAALPAGVEAGDFFLRLSDDGAGGTYFVYPSGAGDDAAPVAVFKPAAEEVGAHENPRGNDDDDALDERFISGGFVPGEGYRRETLAYELPSGRLAGVPHTATVTLPGKGVGSLQRFCPRMLQSWSTTPAKFDVASVQSIAVFDVQVLNCDRHGGNLLVPRDAPGLAMVPIDHGFVLPEQWSDPDFEWALWPQAKAPVVPAVRAAVAALDADADAQKVEAELGPGPAEVVAVTTRLLKTALADGKKYTLKDVADFCRRPSLTEPAGLEELMARCRRDLDDGGDIDTDAVQRALDARFP